MDYIVRIKPIEAFGTIATRLHIRLFYVLFGSTQTCFLEYKTFDNLVINFLDIQLYYVRVF